MADMPLEGSCKSIASCDEQEMFIDPCNCQRYYECVNKKLLLRDCPPGTVFKPPKIFSLPADGICDIKKPWARCEQVSNSKPIEELRNQCLSPSSSSVSTSTSSSVSSGSSSSLSSGGGNGGAIAGAVIAVLLIAAVVVCVVFYVKKRGNPIRHLQAASFWRRKTQNASREDKDVTPHVAHVSAVPSEEEVYACIDDAAMCRDEDLVTVNSSASPRAWHNNAYPNQNIYSTAATGSTGGGNRQAVGHVTPAIAGYSAQREVTTDEPSSSPLDDNIDTNGDRERAEGASAKPAEKFPLDPQHYLLPRPLALDVRTDQEETTMEPPYFVLEDGGHEDGIYVNDVDD